MAHKMKHRFNVHSNNANSARKSAGSAVALLAVALATAPGAAYADDPLVIEPGSPKVMTAAEPAAYYTIARGPDWVPVDYRRDVIPGSALDFSRFSNDTPAGSHGWLRRVGGHFEFEGRPGENVRFYGANICFDACFPTQEEAELLVRRLKATGYNSIRLHHHDEAWAKAHASRKVEKSNSAFYGDDIDRFDYLVATAIKAGLYVTTDLYVSRSVKWRDIEIDRDGEVPKAWFKALITFHEPAFRNWLAFATSFMEHVNPYTGRRYADEPGMPLVCLVNEGNYRVNWAKTAQLPCVREAWSRWAAAKLAEDPYFAGGDDISDPARLKWNKLGRFTHTALATFMAEMEEKSYARELAAMREIGAKALFTSLNHPPFHAPDHAVRQRLYDYFDDHCYVDQPFWPQRKWRLPAGLNNLNPLLDPEFRLPKDAFNRLWGLPTTMSEWNFAGPNAWRGMGGLLTGAMAAGQEWSGVWRFAYAHHRDVLRDGAGGFFDIAKDPLNMLAERTAVPLFLRGDFAPLPRKIALMIDEKAQRPKGSQMPAFFPEWRAEAVWRSQVGVAFPGTEVSGAEAFDLTSVMDDAVPPLDLGNPPQMRIDREAGTFAVETPLTCGGFATNGTISAGALTATVVRGGPTTIAATSLDGKPLGESGHVLVTHLTDAQAEGRQFGDETRTRMLAWGHQPTLIRDGEAEIALQAPLVNNPFQVWALGTDGKREGIVASRFEDGRLLFTARVRGPNGACMAYEIDGNVNDTGFPMAAGAATASTTTN